MFSFFSSLWDWFANTSADLGDAGDESYNGGGNAAAQGSTGLNSIWY